MSTADEDFDPSRFASARFFKHTTMKGTQIGALFGCGVILPILALRGYRSGKPLNVSQVSQALTYSTAGGLTLANGAAVVKWAGMDREGLEERVYRLHYNSSQNRCDLFSGTCGILSAAVAPFLLNNSAATIIGAFTVGTAMGTLAHILTAKDVSAIDKALHELKS